MKNKPFDITKKWNDLSSEEKDRFIREETSSMSCSSQDVHIEWGNYCTRMNQETMHKGEKDNRGKISLSISILLMLFFSLFVLVRNVNALPFIIQNGSGNDWSQTKVVKNHDRTYYFYDLQVKTKVLTKAYVDLEAGTAKLVSKKELPYLQHFHNDQILTVLNCHTKESVERNLLSIPFITSKRGLYEYEVVRWFPFKDKITEYAYDFSWNEQTKDYRMDKRHVRTKTFNRVFFTVVLVFYVLLGIFLLWRIEEDKGIVMTVYACFGLGMVFPGWYLLPLNGFFAAAMATIIILCMIGITIAIVASITAKREQ